MLITSTEAMVRIILWVIILSVIILSLMGALIARCPFAVAAGSPL